MGEAVFPRASRSTDANPIRKWRIHTIGPPPQVGGPLLDPGIVPHVDLVYEHFRQLVFRVRRDGDKWVSAQGRANQGLGDEPYSTSLGRYWLCNTPYSQSG